MKSAFITASVAALATGALAIQANAQVATGQGVAEEIYQTHCAACHGKDLEGAIGPSLIDDNWLNGASMESLTYSIATGYSEREMPGFADTLSPETIRSLVIYLAEEKALADAQDLETSTASSTQTFKTKWQDFRLEQVYHHDGEIWGIELLPDGGLLATVREGPVLHVDAAGAAEQIEATPHVWYKTQGGMMDVRLHPSYRDNGWIYLSFSAPSDTNESRGMTRIVRGQIKQGRWTNEETIFQSNPNHETETEFHFGSRIEFRGDHIYFSVGDRGYPDRAQDLGWPTGKIHRLLDDGQVPIDNPFLNVEGALPSIYSYGHRNPQGLAQRGIDGTLFASEHGPRGGDEINTLQAGRNYGWPIITYGMNYDGTPMTAMTEKDDMEQPLQYWVPSIATAGITAVCGAEFPYWYGDLLVSGLQSQELHRLRFGADGSVEDEILLKDLGRVRDVAITNHGGLYFVINETPSGPSTVFRMVANGPSQSNSFLGRLFRPLLDCGG